MVTVVHNICVSISKPYARSILAEIFNCLDGAEDLLFMVSVSIISSVFCLPLYGIVL